MAPKSAEMQAALAELDTLAEAERGVLAQAAALLAKIGVKGPLVEPPAADADGADDDDE